MEANLEGTGSKGVTVSGVSQGTESKAKTSFAQFNPRKS